MTKARVPVYATTARPDLAQKMGFHGSKFPLPYGPEAGAEGMRKNIDFCRQWREKCGPDFPLMLDCYMALDVNYAAELARKLQESGCEITWIEEPLMPDEYAAHGRLAKKMEGMGISAHLATGRPRPYRSCRTPTNHQHPQLSPSALTLHHLAKSNS